MFRLRNSLQPKRNRDIMRLPAQTGMLAVQYSIDHDAREAVLIRPTFELEALRHDPRFRRRNCVSRKEALSRPL